MPSQRKKYYKNDFILRTVPWSKNAKDTGCDKVALSSDKMEWCKGEIASSTDFTALGSEWINIKCCCTWDHRTFITRSTKDSKPPCRKQDRNSWRRQEITCVSFDGSIYIRLKSWAFRVRIPGSSWGFLHLSRYRKQRLRISATLLPKSYSRNPVTTIAKFEKGQQRCSNCDCWKVDKFFFKILSAVQH